MTFTPLVVTYGLARVGVRIGFRTTVALAPDGDFSGFSAKRGVATMLESMDADSSSGFLR